MKLLRRKKIEFTYAKITPFSMSHPFFPSLDQMVTLENKIKNMSDIQDSGWLKVWLMKKWTKEKKLLLGRDWLWVILKQFWPDSYQFESFLMESFNLIFGTLLKQIFSVEYSNSGYCSLAKNLLSFCSVLANFKLSFSQFFSVFLSFFQF